MKVNNNCIRHPTSSVEMGKFLHMCVFTDLYHNMTLLNLKIATTLYYGDSRIWYLHCPVISQFLRSPRVWKRFREILADCDMLLSGYILMSKKSCENVYINSISPKAYTPSPFSPHSEEGGPV